MIFVQGQGLAFIRQIQKEKPLQKLDLKKLLFDLPSPTPFCMPGICRFPILGIWGSHQMTGTDDERCYEAPQAEAVR